MEILLNTANLLYVLAYFTLDMLRLRILTITAATCLALYFYSQPEPMLNVVFWNLFFIGLNVGQITRLMLARRRQFPLGQSMAPEGNAKVSRRSAVASVFSATVHAGAETAPPAAAVRQ